MKILLTTFHAKYSHASLALPSLAASCTHATDSEVVIREYTVNEPRELLLRLIMAEQASLVAFSCYIWNIEQTLRIASDIKKIAPDTMILLGGPEASFGVFELMHAHPYIDFVIKGEGERSFGALAAVLNQCVDSYPDCSLLQDIPNLFFRDELDIASGPLERTHIDLDTIPSPFAAGLIDFSKPLTYCETSRGCPFTCAFCLSSVEGRVRSYSMERIKSDLLLLMERETPQIKFVDRTFNYDLRRAMEIWRFIAEHNRTSHFHFEIAADLLDDAAIELLKEVPKQTFRFEIGVQSTSEETLAKVGRTSNMERLYSAIRRLRNETAIELHLDLVAGLPGENYEGFLASLRTVLALKPHVTQVEPLKVLKGSPMREIAAKQDYRYSSAPPYTILRNPWLSYGDICRIETIGRLLDLFYNHGGFTVSLTVLQQSFDAAHIFDLMAHQAEHTDLAGRTTRRRYELFAELTEPLLHSDEQVFLHDALFFDYCRKEMPQMGKLPGFATQRLHLCSWPGRKELPDGIDLDSGQRIKAFRCSFLRDYRAESREEAPATITFIYASGAGTGLQVLVV